MIIISALALLLSVGQPVAVPGPVCAVPDNLSLAASADLLRIGEDAYFRPICDTCDHEFVACTDLLFAFNSARLRPSAAPILKALYDRLSADTVSYFVNGHTDWIGSDLYNMRLSLRRAAAVRTALIRLGISAARLTAHGYGETRPVADNRSPVGRSLNRRVEVLGVFEAAR